MAQSCTCSISKFSLFSSSSSAPTLAEAAYPSSTTLPFINKPLPFRNLKVVEKVKNRTVKAIATSPTQIWSIREDLQVPSSPYFPACSQGQGPPPEQFRSVMNQLLQSRIIRCGGAVDDDMANMIVAQLLYLDAVDPTKDIIMYINSPGGSVTAGMAIFDIMRHIRPDVSTVCVGLAASMGAFLLGAGAKGKRYSLPNSRIMIHQPLGGAQGWLTDIDVQADEMMHHKANLTGHLALFCNQSLEKLYSDTDRDYFMSAKEAKDYGLIDGVIFNPRKAFPPLAAPAEQK